MHEQESVDLLGHSEEEVRIVEKCHVSDIIKGVVTNDIELESVGRIPIESGESY